MVADCLSCARPIMDTAYVCHTCSLALEDRLRQAAELWADLDITITRQDRLSAPGPHTRGHAPAAPIRPDSGQLRHYADQADGWASGLPVNLAASDAADSIRNTIETWLRVVVHERYGGAGEPPQGPICTECEHPTCEQLHAWRRWMPPPTTMPAATRWLARQLGWVRYKRWADEAFEELSDAAALVWSTVDRPAERVDAGECWVGLPEGGRCRARLSARPGAARVVCRACGAEHDAAARREWLLEQARDYRGSAVEVARWLAWLGVETTPAMVRGLAHRDRITADGWGRYRLGDVEQVRLEQIKRERGKVAA